MLEPYALKGACTVLRGGGEGNLTSLPDYSRANADRPLGRVLPAAAEFARAPRPATVGVGQVAVTQPAPGLEGPGHRVRQGQEVSAAGVNHRDARARAAW